MFIFNIDEIQEVVLRQGLSNIIIEVEYEEKIEG